MDFSYSDTESCKAYIMARWDILTSTWMEQEAKECAALASSYERDAATFPHGSPNGRIQPKECLEKAAQLRATEAMYREAFDRKKVQEAERSAWHAEKSARQSAAFYADPARAREAAFRKSRGR